MKIRILGNSIRFRVSMDEMEELSSGKQVLSETEFLSNCLLVKVVPDNNPNFIDLKGNTILLNLNLVDLKELHQSTSVGLSFVSEKLSVLFEKDFQCLTDRGEDESKLYRNPRLAH